APSELSSPRSWARVLPPEHNSRRGTHHTNPRSVTYTSRRTSPLFHLGMTILTSGLWLPVWMFAAMNATRDRKVVTKTHGSPAPQPPQYDRIYTASNGRPYRVLPNGQSVWV